MLDLEVTKVDSREVDSKKHPLDTLFFPSTNPTSESFRTVTYKNTCPIPINYHWSVYKTKSDKIILEDEETHYRVEPATGQIEAEAEIEFKIFFSPLHAEPYYEYADFIIENIPINSMRDPPSALKEFAEQAAMA